jgi:DNA mismatch repair protein MSH6
MDELGRGTSTFDGTAIASATVLHLVERAKCLSLFATHYHSLLDEWQGHPNVQLGHMECVVENANGATKGTEATDEDGTITFLYTLGEGGCPKSFGINVARLARLPQEVVASARQASSDFELVLKKRMTSSSGGKKEQSVIEALENGNWNELLSLHESDVND